MKKQLATSLLAIFAFGFIVNPACAILDKNKNQETVQTQITEYINLEWWKQFDDEYLNEYIEKAIQNNHDIKTVALKIEQAKINVTAVRSKQLPQVSVGVSPVLGKLPGETKTMGSFALPIMASYELDLFGKNWDKTKSAKKALEATKYDAQSANISIVSMVGTIYYNLVKLDKVIEIQKELVKDRENIYSMMKISNEEGIASTSDLILAEKAYVLSQNELLDYEKARQTALTTLAVLIGDSPNNINEYKRIAFDDIKTNLSIPESISSEIIVNRPDYKAMEKQLEAKGLDTRVAKKEFLPTIDILGLLTFVSTSSASSMSFENALGLLGANAMLPIFTGFARVANLKMNKNVYSQLLEQYQKTNLVATQEVNDSLYNLKSDNEKLLNNQKALDLQEKDYSYSELKYAQGVISKLDLLQQKESLVYTQKLLVQSKMDCFVDKIGLYKATGAKI